jgi:hypothetical protein
MKYTGKLFGKVGKTYIPLILTSEEVDEMERDKARLDWLERECFDLVWEDQTPGVIRASDGQRFHGDTRREAIDAAIHDENS